jgi:hypothetical protein
MRGFDLLEALLQCIPRQRRAFDANGKLHDSLECFEVAETHSRELGGEIAAVASPSSFDSWIDMRALKARISCRTSATGLPLIAALIIEVEAWLIEQPWPPILTSRTCRCGFELEVEDDLVAAQRVESLDLVGGRNASSPRLRGER